MRFGLDVSTGPDATRSSAQMSTFRSQTALVRCGRIRSNHVRSRGSQERTGSGEPIADSGRGWRATRPQHRSARPAPVHGKGAVLHQANSEGCALPAIRSGRVDRREGTNQYPLMTDSDQRPATARSCSPGSSVASLASKPAAGQVSNHPCIRGCLSNWLPPIVIPGTIPQRFGAAAFDELRGVGPRQWGGGCSLRACLARSCMTDSSPTAGLRFVALPVSTTAPGYLSSMQTWSQIGRVSARLE